MRTPTLAYGDNFICRHCGAQYLVSYTELPIADICAGSCDPMLAIATTSEHTGQWTRMRRSPARFSGPESLVYTRSLADFITATSGFRFSVHTGRVPASNCPMTVSYTHLRAHE